MKKKFYVTFGQRYRVEEHPRLGYDPRLPEGYFVVHAIDYHEARRIVGEEIGEWWSGLYPYEEDRSKDGRHFYPLGSLGSYGTPD